MPSQTYQYLVPVRAAAHRNGLSVSDVRLAVLLKHDYADASSELLRYTNPKTKATYRLLLQGTIDGRDVQGNKIDVHRLTPAQLRELERNENSFDLTHNPWFEWVDDRGNCVGEPFTSIALDADDEVADLLDCLSHQIAYRRPSVMHD
jgi:hypothetical protein